MLTKTDDVTKIAERPVRLLGLDLVRGVCAISVMIYHYCHLAQWGDPYAMGTFGVYIFFVLSGFALYYVYGRRHIDEKFLKDFYVSRYLRIMPLFFAVAVYRLWGQEVDEYNFTRLLIHATPLIGIADTASFSKVMVGGWSILIEWSFYLLFPILMLFRSMKALLLLFVFTLVLNYTYSMGALFPPETVRKGQEFAHSDTFSFLCYFVGGMLAAKVYLEVPSIMKRIQVVPHPLYVSLIMVGGIFSLPLAIPYGGRVDFLTGLDASIVTLFTVALVMLSSMQQPTGLMARLSTFLGDVSFAVYLIHVYVWNYVGALLDGNSSLAQQFIVSIPLTIGISYLIYIGFERPVRNIRQWRVWSADRTTAQVRPM